MDTWEVIDRSKDNRRTSDIQESWIEKGEEPVLLKEGDVVLLHNWGFNNSDEVIGVAFLYWDKEYHGWDFGMIAGYEVEDNYDKWRQCPRIIGNIWDGFNEASKEEFKEITKNDYNNILSDVTWNDFLAQEKIKHEIKFQKRESEKIKRIYAKKNKVLQEEIAKNEAKISELKTREADLIAKIKGEEKC